MTRAAGHGRSQITATLVALLCLTSGAAAQGTIFVVRHAERADAGAGGAPGTSTDPSLSDVGHARAASLATLLKDAGITEIYVTEFRRTQQTAAPLASALGLTPVVVAAKDTGALIVRLKQTAGNVLVVGHSNTVPDIVAGLGVDAPITIDDRDFDNLLLVMPGEPARLIRLHYR